MSYKDRLRADVESQAAAAEKLTGLKLSLSIQAEARKATERKIPKSNGLIYQENEPVIWRNTFNLIQGQTGSYKSQIAELISSALIAERPIKSKALGFEIRPAPGETCMLIYIDTERNLKEDWPRSMSNIKLRAGYDEKEHPVNFNYTSLKMHGRPERLEEMKGFVAHYRKEFDGHIIVLLDVITDCVSDFNDLGETLKLSDFVNIAIEEQNTTFIGIIHENPGSEISKPRGHLGTELMNKSGTILQTSRVKKDGKSTDLIQLKYLKRRNGSPDLTFFATYDEATEGLIKAAPELVGKLTEKGPTAKEKGIKEVMELLPALLGNGSMSAGELQNKLAEQLGVTKKTVFNYLSDMKNGGSYPITYNGQVCGLETKNEGQKIMYSLVPVPGSIPKEEAETTKTGQRRKVGKSENQPAFQFPIQNVGK